MGDYKSMVKAPTGWLGSIPEHWECKKIGSLFSERKTKVSDADYPPLSVTKLGIVPQLANAAKSDSGDNRKLVCSGDFVINSRSDRKGSCGVSELDGSVSLINIVLTPRNSWDNKYVHYLMRSQPFSEEYYHYGRGIVADLWTTRYSEMKNILLPVPPCDEQEQIVRFLDWKVSGINKLISLKKKEIDLLKERQKTFISNIVLSGTNPGAKKEDSGISWIGDIPSHWKTYRCKYLFSERDERSIEGKEQHLSMSQKYGLVPDTILDARRMLSESYAGGKICYENDLVLNRLKAHLGVFSLAPQMGVISPDYTELIPRIERIIPAYAEAVLKSQKCRRELRVRVKGVTEGFWRLYTDSFNTIVLPVPPLEEQKSIMDEIKLFEEKTANYISVILKEVEVLHELRNKLISDVVTGQIDVRDIEVPEFEFVDEIEDESDEDTDEENDNVDEEE